jgi:hypothetical protein
MIRWARRQVVASVEQDDSSHSAGFFGIQLFVAPFTYSYHCSGSLITYYAPSFIYMALIVTFVSPALDVLMQQAHRRRTRGTWLAAQVECNVPRILWHADEADQDRRARRQRGWWCC